MLTYHKSKKKSSEALGQFDMWLQRICAYLDHPAHISCSHNQRVRLFDIRQGNHDDDGQIKYKQKRQHDTPCNASSCDS